MNLCIFTGNLTKDPELRYTTGNTPVVNFSLAMNERFKQNGETKERVFFADLVAWSRTAELISEHFKKGNAISVEASAREEQWNHKETGEVRRKVVFHVNKLHFLPGNGKKIEEAPVENELSEEGKLF